MGLEIHKTRSSFDEARLHIIDEKKVTLLLDGGANEGQWASRVRRDGYSGRILSVEPGARAFSKLQFNSRNDPLWTVSKHALGSKQETLILHLASNYGMSSSLKKPERHLKEFPSVTFSGTEEVPVTTIENLLQDYDDNVMLKLDVQGFELEALEGICEELPKIVAVELELTLQPMYCNEASVGLILFTLNNLGFELFSISEFGKLKNGQVTYFDVIATRKRF